MPQDDDFYQPYMTIPDMLRHGGVLRPPTPTIGQLAGTEPATDVGGDPLLGTITGPGGRPEVYMRSVPFSFSVTTTPQPITNARTSVDVIIIDTPTTALNSVFFGYGSGISTGSGLEVRPGIPLIWGTDNTREMWELQRMLEYIGLLLTAMGTGAAVPTLPTYRAPRVVLDPSAHFLVAAATTAISVTLVYVPEMQ